MKKRAWVQVQSEIPHSRWWPEAVLALRWKKELSVERWNSDSIQWSALLDSAKTLTLFGRQKVLLIQDAEKWLKACPDLEQAFGVLDSAPHFTVFCSTEAPPQKWDGLLFTFEDAETQEFDRRLVFDWIDSVQRQDLSGTLTLLERCFEAGESPFAILQLLTRDFRLGRMIHYALDSHLSESEIAKMLKVSPYAVKKWTQRPRRSRHTWAQIFDRLLKADLDLKSSEDSAWVIRKLCLDFCQLRLPDSKNRSTIRSQRQTSVHSMPLWQVSPSFA